MAILVTYASTHGATHQIAERIASTLRAAGLDAEARPVRDVGDLDHYDAVVIGSAVYNGSWLTEAVELVERHRAALAARPVWLFSVGAFGDRAPLVGRFIRNEPRERDSLRRAVRPRGQRVFAGVVERDQFPLVGRLVFRGFGGRWGDNRDWMEIDAWSDAIARELTMAPAAAGLARGS